MASGRCVTWSDRGQAHQAVSPVKTPAKSQQSRARPSVTCGPKDLGPPEVIEEPDVPRRSRGVGWCRPRFYAFSYPEPPVERALCYPKALLAGTGWGYCPPCGGDPRRHIRPRDQGLPDSTRPTGAPYFTKESHRSCPPHEAPLAMKGGFNFDDWLATVGDREPPEHLRDTCLASLCTWCEPQYLDCHPHYQDPSTYILARPCV